MIFQPSQRQMKTMEPSDQSPKVHEAMSVLEGENTRLIKENQNLIKDLEDCKAELFKRMPHTEISDASIQNAVEKIWISIDSFVYDIMRDDADDALYKLCQRKRKKQEKRKSHYGLSNFIRRADIG